MFGNATEHDFYILAFVFFLDKEKQWSTNENVAFIVFDEILLT